MAYLEDTGKEEIRFVECVPCAIEDDQEGTHYLDSETFRWMCSHCGTTHEIHAPAPEPDPDDAHDREVERRIFGD